MAEQTFEREVLDRLKTIEVKLDGYKDVKETVYENQRKIMLLENEQNDTKNEIKAMQDENRWLKRTVVAALITAAVGVLFVFLKAGMGI